MSLKVHKDKTREARETIYAQIVFLASTKAMDFCDCVRLKIQHLFIMFVVCFSVSLAVASTNRWQ